MIKFAIKASVATAAVYYIKDQGIWKTSNETQQTYQKLKETVTPYVHQASSQLPFEIPELPERNVMSSVMKESWNKGVLTLFKVVTELPQTASNWTSKGIEYVKQNEDIKKLFGSS